MPSDWTIGRLKYSGHALRQMFSRQITEDAVRQVIVAGEIVADYPDDTPYPSRLLLGFLKKRPIHVVIGYNATETEAVVITAYEPDTKLWSPDFKTRKRP